MDTLYDIFDIIAPSDTEIVVSRRNSKIKHVEPLIPDPKRKKKYINFPRKIVSRGMCCRERTDNKELIHFN